MTAIYAATIAVSAFLVFWIQPLVARMLLPLLGGAPAVWNTVVLFFQGMLLLGYVYAHGLARLPTRSQLLVHGVFFLLAAIVVPGQTAAWASPPQGMVVWWLLGNLGLYIALPYVFLTSTAPLLQYWFGSAARQRSTDPYFLYAASNLGSFAALLAFPVLLERFLPLSAQITAWQRLFFGLGAGLAVAGLLHWNNPRSAPVAPVTRNPESGLRDILRWLGLAFVPSSLMLGLTTHITTDIAAVSFFWIAPLALYLATYVVAFSRFGERVARVCRFLLPLALTGALLISFRDGVGALLLVPIELVMFTCIGMVLHFRLYRSRPPLSRLTNFYLWVAFGGFLGGLLNGLLAPAVFHSIVEYPLVLAAGLTVVEWPAIRKLREVFRSRSWHGLTAGDTLATVAVVLFISAWVVDGRFPDLLIVAALVLTSMLAGAYAVGAATGGRLVAALCYLLVLGSGSIFGAGREIFADRSFFGAFSVFDTERGGIDVRIFTHGTTMHGLQAQEPGLSLSVQSYYAGIAPLFRRFLATRGPANIAVTGLGAGNLACLGNRRDRVTFFEIDPAVEDVARRYFTYLERCQPTTDVILGDARLQLAKQDDAKYDLLILDAFSSDAVPIHLLTNEAAREYERVLKADGIMAFHISNRYLDLKPVLGRLARLRGWNAWLVTNTPGADEPLAQRSEFVVVSGLQPIERFLDDSSAAMPLPDPVDFPLWTDEYSNLLRILRR